MTTETDLRDLLTSEADGALRSPANWDDVVRRGVHHRRVARVRQGIVAGGVVLLAVVGTVAIGAQDRDREGLVTDDPTTTTTRDLNQTPRPPDLEVAGAQGAFVTIVLDPAAPSIGFDPCADQSALVTESASDVTVAIQPHSGDSALPPWAACESGPFISWGRVELTDPLGDRVLIDASDGQPVTVVDGPPILFPTWLPDTFDLARWSGTIVQVNGEPGWGFRFSAGPASVTVHSGPMGGGSCPGVSVDVRGTQGLLCDVRGGSTSTPSSTRWIYLAWTEDGQTQIIDLRTGGADLTVDDVLRIAEELEPLG